MNPNAFKGTLTPDPNNFTITVDCLIIRGNEIAFEMHGNDDGDPYYVDGKCFKQSAGYYRGPGEYKDPETKLSFDGKVESYPVIYILKYTPQEYGCDIEGFWFERVRNRESIGGWLFEGSLEHLHLK